LEFWDDKIWIAIAHPIRRRILECLSEENESSFRELLEHCAVSNHGKLGFHIRSLKGLVESDSSTKRFRLTDRGRLATELIWDCRLLLARQGTNLEHESTTQVRRLMLGDHAVLFYDTEDEKREKTFPFLLAGLLRRRAVVYLVSEDKLVSERWEIKRYGLAPDKFHKEAFTIIPAEEWYLRKGKAQAKTIISNWQKLAEEKRKAGFGGLYASGEVDIFYENAESREVLRYEAALGQQLAPNMCGLCLYNVHSFLGSEEQLVKASKSHGKFFF